MIMLHLYFRRRLLAYRDGDLPAETARRVEAHVGRCARCRAELDSIRAASAMARQLPLESAPEFLWRDIEAGLDAPPVLVKKMPRRVWRQAAAALAAGLVLAIVAYRRHVEPGWAVVRVHGAQPESTGTLGVGQWLVTGPSTVAHVAVGQIGEVDVEPNSRVRLLRARPADNRLSLAQGEISARIWAPPRLFFVETPAAVAVDLGCAYKLSVDDHGAGLLRVTIGWVELEEHGRESMVPAGAACRMRPGFGPGTPYFEDASAAFTQALARFDFNHDAGAVGAMLQQARPRDAFTLVHLLERVDRQQRGAIYDRAAALTPVPAGITREGALAGNREMLRRWIDDLAWSW
jgi:anti-sigma factor ChrR (cupin superfamily)